MAIEPLSSFQNEAWRQFTKSPPNPAGSENQDNCCGKLTLTSAPRGIHNLPSASKCNLFQLRASLKGMYWADTIANYPFSIFFRAKQKHKA